MLPLAGRDGGLLHRSRATSAGSSPHIDRTFQMTIYRLYAENGNRAGFWIQHRSWENACAQVTSIAGHDMGKLPGAAPTHDGAPVTVSTFDVRSGRKLTSGAILEHPDDRNFSRIAEPSWFHPRVHFYGKAPVGDCDGNSVR